MLRRLTVERKWWLDEAEFEDAIAATNLLPGPASTQLAIFCAWRLRGLPGALVGGACFICPGLVAIIVLAAVFLATNPPAWIKGAALGAGAAVAPVAVQRRDRLDPRQLASCRPAPGAPGSLGRSMRWPVAWPPTRWGPSSSLVLLGCGLVEAGLSGWPRPPTRLQGLVTAPLGCRGHRRVERPHVGRPQGRRAVVRRGLRDHPVDAGRRGAPLPLDDEQPVPERGGAGTDHAGPGRANDRRRRAMRPEASAGHCWRLSSPSLPRSSSSSPVPVTSAHCGRTGWPSPSSAAPAQPPSAPSPGASIPLALALAHVWQVVILAAAAVAIIGLRRSVVLTLLGAGLFGAVGAALGLPVGA